jgi:hypothetical protein
MLVICAATLLAALTCSVLVEHVIVSDKFTLVTRQPPSCKHDDLVSLTGAPTHWTAYKA